MLYIPNGVIRPTYINLILLPNSDIGTLTFGLKIHYASLYTTEITPQDDNARLMQKLM
jgi:hypothetical protein